VAAAWAASSSKDTYLSAHTAIGMLRQEASLVPWGHSLLVIFYQNAQHKVPYQDLGGDFSLVWNRSVFAVPVKRLELWVSKWLSNQGGVASLKQVWNQPRLSPASRAGERYARRTGRRPNIFGQEAEYECELEDEGFAERIIGNT